MEINGIVISADVESIVRDIRLILRNNGIDLLHDINKSGGNVMTTCIAHGDGMEKKPSCGISLYDKSRAGRFYPAGTVHCFTCGYTADFSEFVSNCFGKRDGGAFGFKWLINNYVTLETNSRPAIRLDFNRGGKKIAPEFTFVSEEELDKYRFIHSYMYKRKLNDEIIEKFDIGYDAKTRSLTFPIANKEGKIIMVQRRSVEGKKFFNDADSLKSFTLYGIDKLYELIRQGIKIESVTICESILDSLVCWKHKRYSLGLMQLIPSEAQLDLINELPVRKLVIATDNDKWGEESAHMLKDRIKNKVLYRLIFPIYAKDCNDMTDEDLANAQEKLL